jgi:hypothetical protein
MRRGILFLVGLAAVLGATAPVRADEFKPAYLQLSQVAAETYDVLWKIPAIDEFTTLGVKPRFPDGTEVLGVIQSTYSRGTTVQRWRSVPGGLDEAVAFVQLSQTRIDVLAPRAPGWHGAAQRICPWRQLRRPVSRSLEW